MKKETLEKANRLTEKIRELKKLQTVGFEIRITMFSDYAMSICDKKNADYFNIESRQRVMQEEIDMQIVSEILRAEDELEAL